MFKVEGDVKRLLRGGREVEDALAAVIIKNLKAVQVCHATTFMTLS